MPEDETVAADRQPRRTAMQAAEAAHALAESARTEADNAVSLIDNLSEKVTDLGQRLTDLSSTAETPDVSEFASAEELGHQGARVGFLARDVELLKGNAEAHATELTAFREEMGGYQGAVNRKLDELRSRTAALESWREGVSARLAQDLDSERIDGMARQVANIEQELAAREVDPVSASMEEDHISDVVERLVRERVDAILARLEAVERRETMYNVTATTESRGGGTGAQRKVLQLMRQVDVIGKDRQAEKNAGGYRFRGIDEAMDAVGRAMRDIGLIGSPQVRSVEYTNHTATNFQGKEILWTTARLIGEYVFVDPEDGSTHPIQVVGEGRDNSDKATSKASSMALKYGLLHGLMIPVTGMPDGDAENPEVINEQRQASQQTPAGAPAQASSQERPQQAASNPTERAVAAVTAVQSLHLIHDHRERYDRLMAIGRTAAAEGLLDQEVTWKGQVATVRRWLDASRSLFEAGTRDDAPPPPEPDGF